MPFLVPREGDVQLLVDLMGGGPLEDWSLGLFNAAITPAETDTAATYTAHEAAFDGYERKPLKRAIGPDAWSPPVLRVPSGDPTWCKRDMVGHSRYGSAPQSWTCSGVGDSVFGYFIVGVTSGKLICAEPFDKPWILASGAKLAMTPVFEAA